MPKRTQKTTKKHTLKAVEAKVNKITRLYGPEIKYQDVNIGTGTAVDYNGTFLTYNAIGQGDTGLTRDGDQLKNVRLDLNFIFSLATTNVASLMRLVVIWDKENTISATNGLLSIVGGLSSPISQYSQEYRKNYQVLYDKAYTLDATNKSNVIVKKSINLRDKLTVYNAGSSTIRKGALKVLLISSIAAASADRPLYVNASRYYFAA